MVTSAIAIARDAAQAAHPVWAFERLPAAATPRVRFAYGLMLPFAILKRIWNDPVSPRAYLRLAVKQLGTVVFFTILCFTSCQSLVELANTLGDVKVGWVDVEVKSGGSPIVLTLASLYATICFV